MCVSLVLVSLLLMLSSCAGDGDSVLIKISKAMDELSSYEADGELNIAAYYNNEKLNITGESKSIYSEEGDLYYYSKSDVTVKHTTFTNSTTVLEAYNDGEYLLMYSVGDEKTRLRSEHTESEITEYFEDRSEFGSIFHGYSKISASKNKSKGYDVKLSNYDKKTIRTLNADLGFPIEKGGATITDISVTISTHSNYLINEINVDYVFSSNDFSGSEKTLYSNYDAAEKIESGLLAQNYTSVADARVVPMLMSHLNSKTVADKGSFRSTYSVVMKVMETENEINQSYDVSYGYKNDRFWYTVDHTADDEKNHEEYENNGEGLAFCEAKAYIDGLIDPFSFSADGIHSVERQKKSNGTVIYTIGINTRFTPIYDIVKQIFSAANASYERSSVQLVVEFKGNELVSMTYTIEALGKIYYAGIGSIELPLTIESKTTFE